ncbi:MAG: hypothetical protein M3N53_13590 [Actinomycetota bacterium]|nr:hypothetical protein [Actinomycetota bacterium]
MAIWFLLFLALIWAVVFLPGAVRARQRTPLWAAERFKQLMSTIAPPRPAPRHAVPRRAAGRRGSTSGRWIVVPVSEERAREREAFRRAQRRRRRLLALLVGTAAVSAIAAIAARGVWVDLHLMIDGILVFYVAMLFELKRRRDERFEKVRPLSPVVWNEPRAVRSAGAGGGHDS